MDNIRCSCFWKALLGLNCKAKVGWVTNTGRTWGIASLGWEVLPGTSSAVQITRVMADINTATILSGDSFKNLEDSFLSTDEDSLVAR